MINLGHTQSKLHLEIVAQNLIVYISGEKKSGKNKSQSTLHLKWLKYRSS